MESVSNLQRYQVGAQDGKAVDAQSRFVEIAKPGGKTQTLEIRPPVKPPSGFASLIGAMVGPSADEVQSQSAERAALALFRQDLVKVYGKDIADLATRGLKDHLTVASASRAMTSALGMKHQSQANTDLLATRIDATFQIDSKSSGKPAAASSGDFKTSAPSTQMCRLLGRIALGADLHAPMLSREQTAKATAQALALFDQLRQTPGMSSARCLQILKFAASGSHNQLATQTVLDLIKADPKASRAAFGGAFSGDTAVVGGDTLEGHVPRDFSARASTRASDWDPAILKREKLAANDAQASNLQELHAQFAAEVESLRTQEKLQEFTARDGSEFQVSNLSVLDGHRSDISIHGRMLSREPGVFPAALREALPEGDKGHALALIISGCVNQRHLVGLENYSAGHTYSGMGNLETSFTHDITVREDGMYAIRSSFLRVTSSFTDFQAHMDIVKFSQPASALYSLEFLIDPGAAGEAPRLAAISTDVVYTSGPLAT